jgi:hypothetical protein
MSITIDIPKNIDRVLDMRSREEHVDKVSVLKQMLWNGVESYLVDQYSGGRISKEKLTEMLGLDIYDVNELLEKHHVKSSISYERFTRGIDLAEGTDEYK